MAEVDPKIMAELLDKPDIRGKVKKMNPETLKWYKAMLVSQGIYAQYVKERKVK
jgi:hypothetical protein